MPKLITHREPETWQALEEAVRGVLSECGMAPDRQVSLTFPRGGAVVDVLATELVDGVSTTTICECKNWKTNVPQDVVHSFRTVMIEAGAHRGYIISKVGFQSGAILAAHSTNVELVTFGQFQDLYFDKWVSARLWAIEHEVGSIASYYEPFGIPGMNKLDDEAEQDRYYQVWLKYLFVGAILPGFSPYMRTLGKPRPLPSLPIDLSGVSNIEIVVPKDLAATTGYQEFLELLVGYAGEGLSALRALNPHTREKFDTEIERED